MIQIALVEDDVNYVAELTEHLKRYEKEYGEKIQITVFNDGEDIVTGYKANFDIILMDIEMKFMDGMTAAEKIRDMDSEVIIIFITNTPQYAINGYKVDALDYVLKPVSYFAFSQRVDRSLMRLKRRTKKYLKIPVKGGIQKIDTSQIYYVEVQDHNLTYHTFTGNYVTKGTIQEVEDSLSDKQYFRCNRCYLVNLEYVEHFSNSDVIVSNEAIKVSRNRKKAMLDALNNYMNGVGK